MKNHMLILLSSLLIVGLFCFQGLASNRPLKVSQNEQPEEDESAASDDLAEDEDSEEEDVEEPADAAIPPAAPAQAEAPAPMPTPEKPIESTPPPPSSLSSAPTTPVVVPKIISPPKTKPNKPAKAKKFVGFKTVKSACSMREAADSASKEVGKTKTGAKLWVEETNESWFKVMRKAGAAYVNTDCLN